MAQQPPDQNIYKPHSHAHSPHAPHEHANAHPQLPLPPQFRSPLNLNLNFDERLTAFNYNFPKQPYIPNPMTKPDEPSESLVMRRPRRTRTTFTNSQIAELEQCFLEGRYLTAPRLAELSAKLALGTAQVKIWFKNRRRRHKLQSDPLKDQSFDEMPSLSPSTKSDSDPPSLHTLSLNGNNAGGVEATTKPNSTQYGDTYNSYYYNGQQHNSHEAANTRQESHSHAHRFPQSTGSAPSSQQFFGGTSVQPHHPSHLSNHGQPTAHRQQQPQQNFTQHQQQFDDNSSNRATVKDVPYPMRMSTAAASAAAAATSVAVANAALSPSSDEYEPQASKNDDNPSLCNSVGSGPGGAVDNVSDEMDSTSKNSIQNRESDNKSTGLNKICKSNGAAATSPSAATSMGRLAAERYDGTYGKVVPQSQHHDPSALDSSNYQCTMDTLMHTYNPHRNAGTTTGPNSAQFAHCFN